MSQERTLQRDDDIFHLLTGDRVALRIPPAELLVVLMELRVNLVGTANKRPFQVSSRVVCLSAAIVPFTADGCQDSAAIIVGGDNCCTLASTGRRYGLFVPAATQATTAITSAPDMVKKTGHLGIWVDIRARMDKCTDTKLAGRQERRRNAQRSGAALGKDGVTQPPRLEWTIANR